MSWIEKEFQQLHFPDSRLTDRAHLVLQRLHADPQASINAAMQGAAEMQGAYRFFDHDSVRSHSILQPHVQATCERIGEEPVVLLVQDTTELDYTDHPPEGSGPLNSHERRGLYDHAHVAFTPQGLPLGTVGGHWVVRDDETLGNGKQRQHDPITTKETIRWLQGYRRACEIARQSPQTHIISVADSEADLYEIFLEHHQGIARGERMADYVIRAGKDRCLPEKDPQISPDTHKKLQKQMQQAPLRTHRHVELPRTPQRAARGATLQIRAQSILVQSPQGKSNLPDLTLHVVLAQEVGAPPGVEPVQWILITSLPIQTLDEILQVLDFYVGRWPIEVFFRIFKTGCTVEEIQMETMERQLPALAMYKIIAWRILYVTMLGREAPELDCEILFTPQEWKPVWKIVTQEELPEEPPDLQTMIQMIATLGGHNGRTTDPPPGPQAMWVGMRRLADFAIAWRTFGPTQTVQAPG